MTNFVKTVNKFVISAFAFLMISATLESQEAVEEITMARVTPQNELSYERSSQDYFLSYELAINASEEMWHPSVKKLVEKLYAKEEISQEALQEELLSLFQEVNLLDESLEIESEALKAAIEKNPIQYVISNLGALTLVIALEEINFVSQTDFASELMPEKSNFFADMIEKIYDYNFNLRVYSDDSFQGKETLLKLSHSVEGLLTFFGIDLKDFRVPQKY